MGGNDQTGLVSGLWANADKTRIYPLNVTIKTMEVPNLWESSTRVNISVWTDTANSEEGQSFRRLITDYPVSKGRSYDLGLDIQCYETFVMKIETTEGFHSKTSHCNPNARRGSIV